MSSSQLSSIQKPIVSLDFDITENGQRRKCDIELSKDELAELVTSLEAANKVGACRIQNQDAPLKPYTVFP